MVDAAGKSTKGTGQIGEHNNSTRFEFWDEDEITHGSDEVRRKV